MYIYIYLYKYIYIYTALVHGTALWRSFSQAGQVRYAATIDDTCIYIYTYCIHTALVTEIYPYRYMHVCRSIYVRTALLRETALWLSFS